MSNFVISTDTSLTLRGVLQGTFDIEGDGALINEGLISASGNNLDIRMSGSLTTQNGGVFRATSGGVVIVRTGTKFGTVDSGVFDLVGGGLTLYGDASVKLLNDMLNYDTFGRSGGSLTLSGGSFDLKASDSGTAGTVLGDLLLENGAVVVDTSPSPVPSFGSIGLMLVASFLLTLGLAGLGMRRRVR